MDKLLLIYSTCEKSWHTQFRQVPQRKMPLLSLTLGQIEQRQAEISPRGFLQRALSVL